MVHLQLNNILTNSVEIESKVQSLKERLASITQKFQYEVYLILEEIYKLRSSQNRMYTIFSLSKENGIDFNEQQIAYIFGYRYLSAESKRLVDENKLKANFVLHIVKKNIAFRDPVKQDKIVNKYMMGEINYTDIKYMNSANLLKIVDSTESINLNNRNIFLQTTYALHRASRLIKDNKDLFVGKELERLKLACEEVKREIEFLSC